MTNAERVEQHEAETHIGTWVRREDGEVLPFRAVVDAHEYELLAADNMRLRADLALVRATAQMEEQDVENLLAEEKEKGNG